MILLNTSVDYFSKPGINKLISDQELKDKLRRIKDKLDNNEDYIVSNFSTKVKIQKNLDSNLN